MLSTHLGGARSRPSARRAVLPAIDLLARWVLSVLSEHRGESGPAVRLRRFAGSPYDTLPLVLGAAEGSAWWWEARMWWWPAPSWAGGRRGRALRPGGGWHGGGCVLR